MTPEVQGSLRVLKAWEGEAEALLTHPRQSFAALVFTSHSQAHEGESVAMPVSKLCPDMQQHQAMQWWYDVHEVWE